jgi:hypothetical protein
MTEGDHIYTLFVDIAVLETKVKIWKGKDFGWRRVPETICELFVGQPSKELQDVEITTVQWQGMAGSNKPYKHKTHQQRGATSPNPYSVP